MKKNLLALLAGLATWASQATAQETISPVHSESATDEQVRALQAAPRLFGGQPIESPVDFSSPTFAETSDFLTCQGISTFVPKGAILHVPAALQSLITDSPTGDIVLWADFLRRYPALVAQCEITLPEATGVERINAQKLDQARASGRLVVAVIQGHPTSMVHPTAAT